MSGDVREEIMQKMQQFSWVDYLVCVCMLSISAAVGVYWGFFKKQMTQEDYLMGGRNLKIIPAAMSLVASFVSGITLLGSPTEIYMYGTQYAFIVGGIFLMSFVMIKVYLPVFHQLGLTSNYEYLSLRFDNRVRLFGSILFTFAMLAWLPIVVYVPALALNQVTGINIHVVTPIMCIVCIFYTSAGGLQAVVWTDLIQLTVMFGAMAIVLIKGTYDVGGLSVVWQRNLDGGRIESPNWDPNPLTRHTVWSLVFGGFFYWLQANTVNQTMIQRYLSLPNLRNAKWTVVVFSIGLSAFYFFCFYCGLLIYAKFYDCDPLETKLVKAKDQLLPFFVMDVLGGIPGLPGVFVAGIISAALSSLSTGLNSITAVVIEDFYKPFNSKPLSDRQANFLMKGTVIVMGALCLGLVYVVERLGTILQLTMTLEAITNGPQLGVFTMGILMPWVNSFGALVGGICGVFVMSWWCLGAQLAIARGDIVTLSKPLSIEGCTYNFNISSTVSPVIEEVFGAEDELESSANMLYRVSYMWYTLAGALVAVLVGSIVSKLSKGVRVPPEQRLLAPQIRRFYPETPLPNGIFFTKSTGEKEQQKTSTPIQMNPTFETKDVS